MALAKFLLILAAIGLAAGFLTGWLGVRHAIDEIPETQRRTMTDFDWIGVEWVERGFAVALLSAVVGIAGVLRYRAHRVTRQPQA